MVMENSHILLAHSAVDIMIKNKSEIESLKDKFAGKTLFIIGNGPSLNITPLEELNSEYTLAMNKISHIYSETSWRPSMFYFAMSPEHPEAPNDYSSENYIGKNINLDIPCFINSEYKSIVGEKNNAYYFDKFKLRGHNPFHQSSIKEINRMSVDQLQHFWSNNIKHHIYHYHTIYGAIQTAVFLGFKQIYLIGCDLGMEYTNPHMIFESGMDPYRYQKNAWRYIMESAKKGNLGRSICNATAMELILNLDFINRLEFLSKEDNKHFTSEYLDSIDIDDGIRVEKEIKKTHLAAKKICEKKGIKIYNATVGGELEIYDRKDIHSLIG